MPQKNKKMQKNASKIQKNTKKSCTFALEY